MALRYKRQLTRIPQEQRDVANVCLSGVAVCGGRRAAAIRAKRLYLLRPNLHVGCFANGSRQADAMASFWKNPVLWLMPLKLIVRASP